MQEDVKQPVQATLKAHHTLPLTTLWKHIPHPHQPRNVNEMLKEEQAAAGFNTIIAVFLTTRVGTMWAAYSFAVLAIVGLLAILNILPPVVALLVAWGSQTFIQLVMLPIIMVGQNVLGRKSELQADEAFKTTMSTYHDIEQIMLHLCAQDAELLRQAKMLEHLLEKNGISLQQLEAEVGNISHLEAFAQSQPKDGAPATPVSTEGEKPSA